MTGYIALACVTIAVFLFVLEPLLMGRREVVPSVPARVADLQARRRYLLEAIRDVDFDRASGKVGDDEYRETRHRYLREAALVSRELERESVSVDDEIELEIMKLRAMAASAERPEQSLGES